MADAEALTHAFMRAHPAEAAAALESVAAAEVAQLLARAPARLGAPVLAAMLPATAARTLEALDDERAMALLSALGVQPAAALLRQVSEPRRSRLIDGLPTAMAVASRLLLGYPPDSAGTWADPEVVALPPNATARDALERTRRARGDASHIFVVAADHQLVGWLTLTSLLRAPEAAPLDTLMTVPDAVLAAQTPLAGAAAHLGWLLHSALPVVESGDRLLGVLTHDALARALRGAARRSEAGATGTLAGTLASGYWSALSGSVAAAMPLLPPAPPVAGRNNDAG
jgi:magnesium transporter